LNQYQQLLDYLPFDPEWSGILALVSLATFLLSLILIPWIVTRLPADYFVDEKRHISKTRKLHPVLYYSIRILKNIFGGFLIIAGVLMLVLPGQGILTILVGVGVADFPRKFRLLRKLAQQASVFRTMNWIRHKAKVAPLRHPD